MEYWVSINNNQVGPMSLDDVIALDPSADMLVWHPGMPDWDKAANLPELAHLFGADYEECVDSQTIETEAQPQPEQTVEEPDQEPVLEPAPKVEEPKSQPQPQPKQETAPAEPCPPNYLVWTVLVTVMCCVPLGVISLIYSSQVKTKYNAGDIEGAKKASSKTELWLILAFVLGLIYQPFSVVMSLL